MSGNISIGPISLDSHQVQNIDIYEQKNLESIQPTRSSSGVLLPSGRADHSATITLIFSGIDEIKKLRSLFILFRSSPVISVSNEMISSSWKSEDINHSHIPVTLNSLSISSVPDIPFTFYCYLTIKRIDARPIFGSEEIRYLGNSKDHSVVNPRLSPFLKKWIKTVGDSQPIGSPSKLTEFRFYGIDALGIPVQKSSENFDKIPSLIFNHEDSGNPIMISESCNIENYFSYNTLLGRKYPFAQHMGTSSRQYSAEIIYDTSSNDGEKLYKDFIQFKELSDNLIRSQNRPDRVMGWQIFSPLVKLLYVRNTSKNKADTGIFDYKENIFTPIQLATKNGSAPNTKQIQINLVENNVNYFKENSFSLSEGGTNSEKLKKFFMDTAREELLFRKNLVGSTNFPGSTPIRADIYNAESESYRLFWPTSSYKGSSEVISSSEFGLLNSDTLRATLLSDKIDTGGRLKKYLEENLIISEKVTPRDINPDNPQEVNPREDISTFDRLRLNLSLISSAIFGITKEEVQRVYNEVRSIFETHLYISRDNFRFANETPFEIENDLDTLAEWATFSFFGDFNGASSLTSESSKIIDKLSSSTYTFSQVFLSELYETIIQRKAPTSKSPRVYSIEGLETAFYKLIIAYKTSPAYYQEDIEESLENNNTREKKKNKKYVFSDLILPTYYELFGDRWTEFAPTYSDYGLINYENIKEEYNSIINLDPAVSQDDIVDPGVWFYFKRFKTGDRGAENLSKELLRSQYENFKGLSLSLDFDVSDLEDLRTRMAKKNKTKEDVEEIQEIITKSLRRSKSKSEKEFQEDMRTLVLASMSKFKDKYLSGSNGITLYIHHNGKNGARRKSTIPGLGGEIYRVAEEMEFLKPFIESEPQAENYTTAYRANEVTFLRNSQEASEKAILSSINQMPEDKLNPNTLYPACKVYLLEFRGDEIFADDVFFSVNSIVSVDITMDKDDAGLAVIKIADPLYNLQNSNFESFKTSYRDGEKYVLSPMRGVDMEGYLNSHKVKQGRPVQIRMGYGNNPDNLEVVFTGKITEIVPGDMLTIVCQDWKSELISRQVSFYNDDPNNYGARDLAIQAVTYADPQGFGSVYSQREIDYILDKDNYQAANEVFLNSNRNRLDVTLENVGAYSRIQDSISNYFSKTIGLGSIAKRNIGLDTRLKNIWYPDGGNYSNLFGWRSVTGWHPLWMNDSWIVPIQSSWDVLKEASRHAWNCIVQVVPYDGYATLFMGHPDQPYIFTNGGKNKKASWGRYKEKSDRSNNNILKDIYNGFKSSTYYGPDSVIPALGGREPIVLPYRLTDNEEDKSDDSPFSKYQSYKALTRAFITELRNTHPPVLPDFFGNRLPFAGVLKNKVNSSPLPLVLYKRVKREILGQMTPFVLVNLYTGISTRELSLLDNNTSTNIESVLSPNFDPSVLRQPPGSGGDFFQAPIDRIFDKLENIYNSIFNKFQVSGGVNQTGGFSVGRPYGGKPHLESVYNYGNDYISLLSELISEIRANSDQGSGAIVDEINSLRNNISGILDSIREGKSDITFAERYPEEAGDGFTPMGSFELFGIPIFAQSENTGITFQRELLTPMFNLNSRRKEIKDNFSRKEGKSYSDIFNSHLDFKVFCYYLCLYLLESEEEADVEDLNREGNYLLPPTMKTFSVTHYVDDESYIIQNNIVASTKEMWNTVLIEHPAKSSANDTVASLGDVYTSSKLNSGIDWNYYPKSDVTQVKGLQFHPGLSLANKKMKVCTEVNAYSPPLLAKLACGHLAEGIKRMYRGNLLIRGKVVKPYDRIILNDKYNDIRGPVEVESVVHHWSADGGWVTNIIPQAVCDSNPGAAILNIAITERAYNAAFDTLDYIGEAVFYAAILSGVGGIAAAGVRGAAAATGGISARSGLGTLLKSSVFNRQGLVTRLKNSGILLRDGAGSIGRQAFIETGGNPINVVRSLFSSFRPAIITAISGYTATELAELLVQTGFSCQVTSAFAKASEDVKQLPVKFVPLIHAGVPFVAGLETDEAVFTVLGSSVYNSIKDIQDQLENWITQTIEGV